MRARRWWSWLLGVALCLPRGVGAQEEGPIGEMGADAESGTDPSADRLERLLLQDLPRLVTAAAFREQAPEEAPSAVVVVTAEEIRQSGARTLGEALERCVGLDLVGTSHVSIRGIGPTNRIGGAVDAGRILLLIDGVRVNDVFTDDFTVGLARGVWDINRIEVVKGPGSALYGTSAFAGVINVVTLDGSVAAGSESRIRVEATRTATAETRAGGSRGAAQGSIYGRLGTHDLPAGQLGVGELRAQGTLRGLSLHGGFTQLGLRPPAAEEDGGGERPQGPGNREAWLALTAEHAFKPGLQAWARVGATGRDGRGVGDVLDVAELRGAAEGRVRLRLAPRAWLTTGAEMRQEQVWTAPTDQEETTSLSRLVGGIYGQVEIGPFSYTHLTLGVRGERSRPEVGGASTCTDGVTPPCPSQMLTPRVGVVSSLPTGTVLKLFVGQAFQTPSLALLYQDATLGDVTFLANPALAPESMTSIEVELRQDLGERVDVRLNTFQDDITDLISPTLTSSQNTLTFTNLYDARVRGIEAELTVTPGRGPTLFANTTLLDAYDTNTYRSLPLVPVLRWHAGVRGALGADTSGWLSATWIGGSEGTEGDPLSEHLALDAALRLDARLSTQLGPGWWVALTARNVLGSQSFDFYDGAVVEEGGREVWLELAYHPVRQEQR